MLALPPASTCTPRPTQGGDIPIACPSLGSPWRPVAPGGTIDAPPRCMPPPGMSCAAPLRGLFADGTQLVSLADGSCACKDYEAGVVPRKLPGTSFITCVPGAAFLADDPAALGGPGLWAADLEPVQQACYGAQACWDMCVFCDGRPRFNPKVCASKAARKLSSRRIPAGGQLNGSSLTRIFLLAFACAICCTDCIGAASGHRTHE